ncbi:MAG: 6-bladed beta-propeller [Tepidanaerobacteraceae bacterium]|nr:6-bladed beta-propeller [Tepidanaerobacteraceae bacterium]
MKYIIIVLVLITLNSCNSSTSNMNIIERIDFGGIQKIKSSRIVSELKFIKLETNSESRFGNIDQIKFHEGNIYILDTYLTKSVFVFTKNGVFLRKLSKIGKGPGEYLSPSCFDFDDKKNLLLLYDRQQNKLMRYSISDLSYVDHINLPLETPTSFTYNEKENLYYYYYPLRKANSHVIIANEKGEKIKNVIKPEPSGKILHGCQCNFYKNNNEVCIFPYFSNKIFSLTKDTIHIKYELQFGPNKMPETELFIKNSNSGDIMKEMMEGTEPRIRMLIPYESASMLIVKYYMKKEVFIGIWDKINNQSLNIKSSEVIDDLGIGGKFPLPIGIFDNKYVGQINVYETNKDKINNQKLKEIIHNAVDEDNPILVLYDFKIGDTEDHL